MVWVAGFRHVGGEFGAVDAWFSGLFGPWEVEGGEWCGGWPWRVGRGSVDASSCRWRVADGGDARRRPVVAGEREGETERALEREREREVVGVSEFSDPFWPPP